MGLEEHRHAAPKSVTIALLTLSDSRNVDSDTTGQLIKYLLATAGHKVVHYTILPEEREAIVEGLEAVLEMDEIQALILNGGTGVAQRDISPEVVEPYLEKLMPGFGELFRSLSFKEIGSAAFLSRSLAGIARNKALFLIPGSCNAARLAMNQLILPELGHIVGELHKEAVIDGPGDKAVSKGE